MICNIDYQKVSRDGEEGIEIVFTYDEELQDSYEIFGEPDNSVMWNLIEKTPPPEVLLLQIRHLINLTVH